MNHSSLPRLLRTIAPAFAMAMFLTAGCGKPSQEQLEAGGTNPQPVKQELVRGSYAEPTSLDPHIGIGNEIFILRDLREGLVSTSADGKLIPAVAERWETVDNLVFTFYLRREARWSNGDPVTAHDFVFSWRRLVSPEIASPYGWYLGGAGIENATEINQGLMSPESLGVTALDDHTLQVKLAEPVAYFVDMLTHTTTHPLHSETLEKYGKDSTKPGILISNGPFQLSTWVVNERIELTQNPHYWDQESVKIDKVTYLPIHDPGAELQRYLAGELDITYVIPPNQISRLLNESPEEVHLDPFLGTRYILFNTQKPPFNDVRLRKALAYAIDRTTIAKKVEGAGEVPSYSLIPPGYLSTSLPETHWENWTQSEREERARSLYREAGYSQDNPLKIRYLGKGRLATGLAAMWKRVLGVETVVESQEFKVFLNTLAEGEFEIAAGTWWGDYNEPSTMLNLMLTGGGTNFSGYSNSEYDALMQFSKHTAEAKDRDALYAKAETLLAEDMPIAPVYQFTTARLVKPHVGGCKGHPLNHLNSKNLWLREVAKE